LSVEILKSSDFVQWDEHFLGKVLMFIFQGTGVTRDDRAKDF